MKDAELSKCIWSLRDKNKTPSIKWSIIKRLIIELNETTTSYVYFKTFFE